MTRGYATFHWLTISAFHPHAGNVGEINWVVLDEINAILRKKVASRTKSPRSKLRAFVSMCFPT